MPSYEYPQDGKIHIRQSDLSRCTPGQVKNLVLEMVGLKSRFSSDSMSFGSDRHSMFEIEMKQTKRLPKVFLEGCLPAYFMDIEIDLVEHKMETELYKDIIFHCQPDAISIKSGVIADPKVSTRAAKEWKSSKQLITYAYILLLRDIRIQETVYLIEQWKNNDSGQKQDIVGYDCLITRLSEEEVLEHKNSYIKPRIEILVKALQLYKEGNL